MQYELLKIFGSHFKKKKNEKIQFRPVFSIHFLTEENVLYQLYKEVLAITNMERSSPGVLCFCMSYEQGTSYPFFETILSRLYA